MRSRPDSPAAVADAEAPLALVLLCQVRESTAAIRAEHVVEILRPLPIEAASAAPAFVLGLAIVRGSPIPVVDAGAVLGATGARQTARFVVLRVAERRVALAVEGVLGVRALSPASFEELPPLLGGADAVAVGAVATLDARLLLVLDAALLIPNPALLGGASAAAGAAS